MTNEAFISSDIIVNGFVILENEEIVEEYKKYFPNYYVQEYDKAFFFLDLDRLASVETFPGCMATGAIQLILKPFMGDSKYKITRLIKMETLNEIKELLIQRNRYDILLNIDTV